MALITGLHCIQCRPSPTTSSTHSLTAAQGNIFSHIHPSPQSLMNCSQVPNRCKIRISTYNSPSLDRCSSLFAESRAQTTDQTEWCAPLLPACARSGSMVPPMVWKGSVGSQQPSLHLGLGSIEPFVALCKNHLFDSDS